LQLKATESLSYIKEALAAHSDIDVVAIREVFEHLNGSGRENHVTITDFSDGQLTEHVQDQTHAADITAQFDLPLLAFGIIALQNYRRYKKGQLTAVDAGRGGIRRGWRSLLCRGAAYVSILISSEPLLALPVSVLSRTTFSRFDVQKQFCILLDQYRIALRERRARLVEVGKSRLSKSSTATVPAVSGAR
jgi:hypothetical protein